MPIATINHATIHYEEWGSGKPLVLVHGFPLDGRIWDGQRQALSGAYRVIILDLPGFGRSHEASGAFSLEDLADVVHGLLQELNAVPSALAGLSMGGYVALAYAKKYPSDLAALILIDTRAEADTPDSKQARQRMIALAQSAGSDAVAAQMLPKMLAPGAEQHRPALAETLRDIMRQCPAETIAHALAAMRDRPDQTANLPSIAVPTLIIVGEDDAITPPAVAEAMHRAIPRSQLVIIRGAGHMSPMEQPQQVSDAIDRFLRAGAGAGSS
jgi:pimeloyl-ACP methyl ester carboxylesterase